MRKLFFSIVSVGMLLFNTACSPHSTASPDIPTVSDIDKITFEPISKIEHQGNALYFFKLKNGTPFSIKQNDVYVSYDIKTSNGSRSNYFKVEADGNKLDIAPNEEVVLGAFAPKDWIGNPNRLDQNHLRVEIKGYLKEITPQTSFDSLQEIKGINQAKELVYTNREPSFVEASDTLSYAEYVMEKNKDISAIASSLSRDKKIIKLLVTTHETLSKEKAVRLGKEYVSYLGTVVDSYNLTVVIKDERGKAITTGSKSMGSQTITWS